MINLIFLIVMTKYLFLIFKTNFLFLNYLFYYFLINLHNDKFYNYFLLYKFNFERPSLLILLLSISNYLNLIFLFYYIINYLFYLLLNLYYFHLNPTTLKFFVIVILLFY